MEDLEITTLPTADPASVPKLNTLGYDADGNAAQVRLSDLMPRIIKAASIDFLSGLFISRQPFVADSSEVYINGLRYTLGNDYKELTDGALKVSTQLFFVENSALATYQGRTAFTAAANSYGGINSAAVYLQPEVVGIDPVTP